MCIRDRYMGNTGVKRKKAYSSAESEGERITENFYFNLLEYIVFLYIKFLSIDEKDCKMPVMQVTEYKKLRVMIEKRVKELMERYKIKKKDFFQIWENTLEPCKSIILYVITNSAKHLQEPLPTRLGTTRRSTVEYVKPKSSETKPKEDAELLAIQLSLIHISEPTRPLYISYAVFCLKKKKNLHHDINNMHTQ
eukprot:TRINITY_DN62214_c0_g1_i1.p1 TRINITY_DN62214_c0_g1~~TRINITY_DN62214_c0_g1_i1.p1  ORF type:complete len:194 (+),score=40.16 TRINITY_DN62214_c0_g1_i1:175-756(+)